MCTRICHQSLSWATWMQYMPSHPISIRSILVLPSHHLLCLLNGLFPSRFPTKILYKFLISPIHARCPAQFMPFNLITCWSIQVTKLYKELLFFSLWYLCLHPIYQHCQQRTKADVFHSIPILRDFLGPSWRHILKQSWEAMVLQTVLNRKCWQTDLYLWRLYYTFCLSIF